MGNKGCEQLSMLDDTGGHPNLSPNLKHALQKQVDFLSEVDDGLIDVLDKVENADFGDGTLCSGREDKEDVKYTLYDTQNALRGVMGMLLDMKEGNLK